MNLVLKMDICIFVCVALMRFSFVFIGELFILLEVH